MCTPREKEFWGEWWMVKFRNQWNEIENMNEYEGILWLIDFFSLSILGQPNTINLYYLVLWSSLKQVVCQKLCSLVVKLEFM